MTNEMMLKRLLDIQIGEGSQFDFSKFRALVKDLEADVRMDNNKAKGNGNLAKLAKAIFKEAPEHQEMMQYSHIENNIQFVLDGYRIAGFYEHIDIPDYEKDAPNTLPPKWFDVSRIIEGIEYDEDKPLRLPTIGELKAEIKIAKSKSKIRGARLMWIFDNGLAVNAQYLLDFMQAYPDMKAYANITNTLNNPLYIESEKGMGILFPIRTAGDKEPGIHEV